MQLLLDKITAALKMVSMNTADEFLATGKKFQLGFLETEKSNPETMKLSYLAQEDLGAAIDCLVGVDCRALEKLKLKIKQILSLREDILQTWESGGRVFICGCGATGRLAMSLEYLHREQAQKLITQKNSKAPLGRLDTESVVAFMAGGDVALVHSLEGFEDYPEYGERHLRQLGFNENDLLISPTEGGETPYVIGATEAAAKISQRAPYFLYCNPDELLVANVERSRRVIENKNIQKMNLSVGPMALAGSTRMQASTVLQLAIGFALLTDKDENEIIHAIDELQSYMRENATYFLTPFIERESEEYKAGRYILYCVRDYPITVFTDTTERAPTFSLTPFSHKNATRLLALKPSLSYLCLPNTKNSSEAWRTMLLREPRALNWPEIDERTGQKYLEDFDFSNHAREFREQLTGGVEHSDFEIFRHKDTILWRLQDIERSLLMSEDSFSLFEHILLKMLLNIHSTLIMGRMGRYKGNMMTWVYPTNGKLIDRASRYIQTLLREDGNDFTYEEVVRALFETKKVISGNQSIVLETCEVLSQRQAEDSK